MSVSPTVPLLFLSLTLSTCLKIHTVLSDPEETHENSLQHASGTRRQYNSRNHLGVWNDLYDYFVEECTKSCGCDVYTNGCVRESAPQIKTTTTTQSNAKGRVWNGKAFCKHAPHYSDAAFNGYCRSKYGYPGSKTRWTFKVKTNTCTTVHSDWCMTKSSNNFGSKSECERMCLRK
ncbi:hypothetical protein Y032_0238g3294 [Ancylostoma ceylanicum]|uniref:BPTI/Kunitz inhibitor domain-containing protein n=1 Tax=Ancylostoma ceylanicum TaxID=53326 RepID=A0A016SE91_9BILA|nr:hypothetical protein Y032_0238g3294 [Ancylostoma ceylanicum]